MPPKALTLTDDDRALIARARIAFREDWTYLEEILWAARGPQASAATRRERSKDAARGQMRYALSALEPRLVSHVQMRHKTGCWAWSGARTSRGTPVFKSSAQRTEPVRRWLWEQTQGAVPDGLAVFPGFDCTKLCVRPDHAVLAQSPSAWTRGCDRLAEAHSRSADTSGAMAIQTMLAHRATVHRFAEVIEHGSPVRAWSEVAENLACLYSREEVVYDPTWTAEQRTEADSRGVLFALPTADIAPGDRVKITRPPMAKALEVLPDPAPVLTLHTISHMEWHVRSVG